MGEMEPTQDRRPVTVADVTALLAELAQMAREEPTPRIEDLIDDCEQDWTPGTGPRRKMTRSRRRAKKGRTTSKGIGVLARCSASGKIQFRDHAEAIQALHHAETARARAEVDGATTTMFAVRAYECDECPFWHITKAADVTVVAIQTHAREEALADKRLAAIRSLAAASTREGHLNLPA